MMDSMLFRNGFKLLTDRQTLGSVLSYPSVLSQVLDLAKAVIKIQTKKCAFHLC